MSARWYQLFFIGVGFFCLGVYRGLGIPDTLPTRSIGALACIISIIADRWSTVRMLVLIEQADQQGVAHGYCESNPLIGDARRPTDFTAHPVVWVLDIGATAFSVFAPWFGVALLIGKGYAAWNNTIRRRELLALVAE